jgi:membrane-associated phospholipid phosphatase
VQRRPWGLGSWWLRPQRPGPLLPAAFRRTAVVIVAVCAAIVAALGLWFAHKTQSGWLDTRIDARMQSALLRYRGTLSRLAVLGEPVPAAEIAGVLLLLCLAARRWRGALLVAVSVPVAVGLTEVLLKPLIHRTLWGNLEFPSGHTTSAFTLASCCAVLLARPLRLRLPAAARTAAALIAFLLAASVAVAVVVLRFHYFTDTVAGAAVGIGTVLATALVLDRFGPPAGPAGSRAQPRASVPAAGSGGQV